MLAKQVVYILCLDDIPTTFLLYLEFFSLANETQFSAVTSLSLQSLKQWRIRKSIHFPNEKKIHVEEEKQNGTAAVKPSNWRAGC